MSQLRVGQRVEATDAYRINWPGAVTRGVVVAMPRHKIAVLRDGLLTAVCYGPGFWRPEPADPALAAFARECEALA